MPCSLTSILGVSALEPRRVNEVFTLLDDLASPGEGLPDRARHFSLTPGRICRLYLLGSWGW